MDKREGGGASTGEARRDLSFFFFFFARDPRNCVIWGLLVLYSCKKKGFKQGNTKDGLNANQQVGLTPYTDTGMSRLIIRFFLVKKKHLSDDLTRQ